MRIPTTLDTRQGGGPPTGPPTRPPDNNMKSLIVIAIIVIAVFIILLVTFLLTSKYRRQSMNTAGTPAKDKLPSLFSFTKWRKGPRRGDYSTSLQDNNELDRNGRQESAHSREMSGARTADPDRRNLTSEGVDRNTSVRSVMTLPAYSPAARDDERILGREGERGGIDTVLEFPETNEDEEQRREGEMESLYQIRLARRREAIEREERRQARREARLRGDTVALAEIRRRAEEAAEESLSQALIVEHQTVNRDRRVSQVQYGDLGVARHDGTRLRANSAESDNRPLLDSAASISGQSAQSRVHGNNVLHTHYRGLSASSVLSSRASSEFEFSNAVRPRCQDATADDFEVVSLSQARSRSGSTSRGATPMQSIDVPREDAPAYEDPPNYESPINTRAPQLPRLPSIQITPEPPGHVDGYVWGPLHR
ncbi:hypothetical protein K504DRAFT_534157 [Pleomassaria siparia CBS 279.74]|uniref:Uncharacterized protein n=1 Tax=Pleomassaria siparia CBS 279.74 TaxID=1314801 RepID=A0A6G1KAQ5_9PLEO|nr:hypothetical protein K504DRAFT_534157 [Pleomassaria siparia CBS 279.74]